MIDEFNEQMVDCYIYIYMYIYSGLKRVKHLNNLNAELTRPKTLKVTYIARFSRNHR